MSTQQKYKILGKRVLLGTSLAGKFGGKENKFTPDKKGGYHQAKILELGSEVPKDYGIAVGDLVEVDKTPGVIDVLSQKKTGKKASRGVLVEVWSVRYEDITAIINPDYSDKDDKDEV